MRLRLVTLLVVIHIALDFANPMMPGAVYVLDGSLDTDAGCCAQREKDSAPAITPIPCRLSSVVPPRKPTLPALRVISASPPAPCLFCAVVLTRSTPTSSPADDD